MPETTIDIVPPFDFSLSLKFAVACRFESEGSDRDKHLTRVIKLNGIPVLLSIKVEDKVNHPAGRVTWNYLEGGHVSKDAILKVSRRMVSAELDLRPFYRIAQKSERFKKIAKKFRGLKPILTPTVFEAAAWAIMGQQVNLQFASTLKKRVVRNFGKILNIKGDEYSLFPAPEDFAHAKVGDLQMLQFSQRKAEYLLGLSAWVARDHYALESLGEFDYDTALERLLSIRGIGIWSANYILMRGAGHLDCLPLGDSGLNRAVKNLYKLKENPDYSRIEKIAKEFMPFRSLFTLYSWYTLMEDEL